MEEDTKSPNTTGTTCAVLKNVQDSTFSEQAEESVIPGVMAAPKNRKKDSPLELISISAEGDEVDTQESHTASSLGNTGTDPFKAKSLIEKQDNLQMTLPSPIPSFVVDAGMATKEVSKKHIEIQAVPGSPVPPASTTFPPRQIVLATPPVSSDGQPASPPLEPGTTKDTSLQVVAELVPDAEELAARVAQQLEEQMDSQWEQHLQQVIQSKVLGTSSSASSRPVVEATLVQVQPVPDKSTNQETERRPKVWTLLLAMIVIGGVIVMVVVFAGRGNRGKGSIPTEAPTESSPGTESLTTMPTNPRLEYFLETLGPIITLNNVTDEWTLLKDPGSPQAQALMWMSEEDEWTAHPDSMDVSLLLERYVLSVLYFSTSGQEWSEDVPFLLTNVSVCGWNNGQNTKGAFCAIHMDGSAQNVTNIVLHNLRLTGTLPWEISLLTNLVTLNVETNALQGPLPFALPFSLQDLLVTKNFLSGSLASNWADTMPNLSKALLGDNQFHGSIPSEMGDLAVLERFIAQANDLTGTVPSDLGRLKLLERVDLSWNRLEGTLPTELGNLQNLNQLYLVGNPALSGSIPSDFGGLTALNILYLQDTSLTGSVDATLCFLNNTSLSITADCLGDEPELECSCCMRCCDTEGEECEVMTSSSRV